MGSTYDYQSDHEGSLLYCKLFNEKFIEAARESHILLHLYTREAKKMLILATY